MSSDENQIIGLAIGEAAPNGMLWNGFELVSLERYAEQSETTMPHLPPIPRYMTALSAEARGYISRLEQGDREAFGIHHNDIQDPVEALTYELLQNLEPCDEEGNLRGGLRETPARVAKAWKHWTSGYGKDPADVLKVFEDGAEGCDEMVVVHNIPVYSKCEHHLADIFGTATVAYIPDGKIVGLSKLPRLVDIFARRLQVQERLTNQVAEAIMKHLVPRGCGVVVKARHMCMESRGIKQAGGYTTTSALRGVFKSDPTVRAEFLALARNGDK